jgi:hypothetical protein
VRAKVAMNPERPSCRTTAGFTAATTTRPRGRRSRTGCRAISDSPCSHTPIGPT